MFARLAQQSSNIKNRTPQRSPIITPRSVSKNKPQKTYSSINKQKKNGSDFYNYQIAWIDDHIYQDSFLKTKKMERVLRFQTVDLLLQGTGRMDFCKAVHYFTPFGAKVNAGFHRGKLDGWVIMEYDNNIQIDCFTQDLRESIRTRFDSGENLWVQASYDSSGKLLKVIKIQNGNVNKIPSFLNNLQIIHLYNQYILKRQSVVQSKCIKQLKIGPSFQYCGYLNQNMAPQGLGIIYSSNQMYAGNFRNGSLDRHGIIRFSNGLIYKGDVSSGRITGQGLIYDPFQDQTRSIKINQKGVQLIIKTQDGFDLKGMPFNIGKIYTNICKNYQHFSKNIQDLCEDISKYYYKELSQTNQDISSAQSSDSNSRISKKSDDYPIWQKTGQKRDPIRIQEDKNSSVDSLDQNSIQQVKYIPQPKSFSGLPKKLAPNFQQIILKNISKVPYPHLKQFQRQRDMTIVPPHSQKIGQIYTQRKYKKLL